MTRIVIRTSKKSVVLRQLVPKDARHYFKLVEADRPHLSQHDDDTARKYPDEASVLRSITNPRSLRKLRFGIWDGTTFVGMVGLTSLRTGVCETGGWTGKQFCRRGYGVITRQALGAYAIKVLGYRRVIAKTHPNNFASQGMLTKAGYRLVRRTKQSFYFAFDGVR